MLRYTKASVYRIRPLFVPRIQVRYNHKDPLGLNSFLNNVGVDEKTSNKSDITTKDDKSNAEGEEEDEITKLLNSLDLQDDIEYDKLEHKQDYSPVNIDESDVIDQQLFKTNDSNNDVITKEKDLLQDILKSYQNIDEEKSNSEKKIFDNLTQYYTGSKLSNQFYQDTLFKRVTESLSSTLDYIDSSKGKHEVVHKLNTIINQLNNEQISVNDRQGFFLTSLLKHKKITNDHENLFEEMELQSKISPANPKLNVLSLPSLFNQCLKTLHTKFNDGALCLTLFNYLKKDLNLYSVCCNQDTYNEILKTYWVFQGKSNIYAIENLYIEMTNNGFQGNLTTFNILKQIIVDYYDLKMGNSPLYSTNLPIWTQEDDSRIESLESSLNKLAKTLNK